MHSFFTFRFLLKNQQTLLFSVEFDRTNYMRNWKIILDIVKAKGELRQRELERPDLKRRVEQNEQCSNGNNLGEGHAFPNQRHTLCLAPNW